MARADVTTSGPSVRRCVPIGTTSRQALTVGWIIANRASRAYVGQMGRANERKSRNDWRMAARNDTPLCAVICIDGRRCSGELAAGRHFHFRPAARLSPLLGKQHLRYSAHNKSREPGTVAAPCRRIAGGEQPARTRTRHRKGGARQVESVNRLTYSLWATRNANKN